MWVSLDEQQSQAEMHQRRQRIEKSVTDRFAQNFAIERAGDLAEMLRWPLWSEFEEALILDTRVLELDGEVVPVGTFLNPMGSRFRAADFPMKEITRALALAGRESRTVAAAGGLAIPLLMHKPFSSDRSIWGGAWVRLPPLPVSIPLSARIMMAAGMASLLGAVLLFFGLQRSVLRPVENIIEEVHSFSGGGLPQLSAAGDSAEMKNLAASLFEMMNRIHGFQGDLQDEAQRASARAQTAERRAAQQERLAAMGTLAAGLAHEINSPLAGALQGLETLRREAKSERATRHGDLTAEALQRIAQLVQRLLQLAPSQIETGEVCLQDVLQDLPIFLESRLSRHRLEIQTPSEPVTLAMPRGDFFPVCLNLVQNALDALDTWPDGREGCVTIGVDFPTLDFVRVTIRDDGPGAPEELLAHLLEPFVSGKEPGAGTGLGLSLAHSVISQIGGELSASNLPEGGFEVLLDLPRVNHPSS
jgi:signal transduction histidine kinase